MTLIEGASANQRGQWRAEVAKLTRGDQRVADTFNKASDASGSGQIEQMRAEADPDAEWLLKSDPRLTFRAVAIAEVIVGVYSAKQAAHPTSYVSTVVIDSRTAKPITLADLFSNEQHGLNRLSEQTKLIFPKVYGGSQGPMGDEPGNRPIATTLPTGYLRGPALSSISPTISSLMGCR